MKSLAVLVSFAFTVHALHGTDVEIEKKTDSSALKIDKKAADSIRTFTVHQFNSTAEGATLVEGQIIRLKFGYRKSISNFNGEVHSQVRDAQQNLKLAMDADDPPVAVVVPPEGLAWFSRVTTNYRTGNTSTAIGRVMKTENGTREVKLLGREIVSDNKGVKIVWTK